MTYQDSKNDTWVQLSGVLMIAAMATFMRCFLVVKLVFLGLFLLTCLVRLAMGRIRPTLQLRILYFYLCVAIIGSVWTLVGLLRPNNYYEGITDSARLYVIWCFAFVILYALLRKLASLELMHKAMVLSGILVPTINLIGFYDAVRGLRLISHSISKELNIRIALGGAFPRFYSLNVISMFVIAPYLITLQFRPDAPNSRVAKLSLLMSLVFVVLSGRRALWLIVAFTPFLILLLAKITKSHSLLNKFRRRVAIVLTLAGAAAILSIFLVPELGLGTGPAASIRRAFSSRDERSIQAPYLIETFLESPIMGTGFGGYGGITRSFEKPWTYELTYYQMLFNLGLVGVISLGLLYAAYGFIDIGLLRKYKEGSAIPFALLIGLCGLCVGAYSNPYFGGFDSLFVIGIVPLLSTFTRGFALDAQQE